MKNKISTGSGKVVRWSSEVISKNDFVSKKRKTVLQFNPSRFWNSLHARLLRDGFDSAKMYIQIARIDDNRWKMIIDKEGFSVLNTALVSDKAAPRRLIFEVIPTSLIVNFMKTGDGIKVIKNFMGLADIIIRLDRYDEQEKSHRIEALLFLLKLDAPTIQRYWEQFNDEPFMIQALKDEYAQACKHYKDWCPQADTQPSSTSVGRPGP